MKLNKLDEMPGTSRLWIFPISQALSAEEGQELADRFEEFISRWKAHGAKISAAFELRYNRFLLVAADESVAAVSGCSIDALGRSIRTFLNEIGYSLSEMSHILFVEEGEVREVNRDEFKKLLADNVVTANTYVFNNTIQTLGELRNNDWQLPLERSWHAKAFLQPRNS